MTDALTLEQIAIRADAADQVDAAITESRSNGGRLEVVRLWGPALGDYLAAVVTVPTFKTLTKVDGARVALGKDWIVALVVRAE